MTSGIADYSVQPPFLRAYAAASPRTVISAARLVSYATGVPLEKGYVYSNTNYILAQMIIERVTHDTYADQLMRRITIPLRLDGPYTCPAAAAAQMPAGYFFDSRVAGASIAAR